MFYHLHAGGERKRGGEDQYIQCVYIQREHVAEWGAVMCVLALSGKGSLVALQLEKLMEDQGTVFSDKLSAGKLQFCHRK